MKYQQLINTRRWLHAAAAVVISGMMTGSLVLAQQPTTAPTTQPGEQARQGPDVWMGPGGQGGPRIFRVQPARAETAPQTFLGVSTRPLDPQMAGHLNLPEGVGLVVAYVEPVSPAAKAGVEEGDILKRLDEQWLINAEQLGVLVRMHEPGDDVSLVLVRKGQEQTVKAQLVEKELPVRRRVGQFNFLNAPEPHGALVPGRPNLIPGEALDRLIPLDEEAMRRAQAELEAAVAQLRSQAGNLPDHEALRAQINAQMDAVRRMMEQQRMELEALRPELLVPGGLVEGARVTIRNNDMVGRLVNENGQTTLHIEDLDGNVLYEGPYPDEAEMAKLPEKVQAKIREFEKHLAPNPPAPKAPPAAVPPAPAPAPAPQPQREQVQVSVRDLTL